MKIRSISLVLVLVLAVLPLAAQESEQTIEELFLQSAIKTQIIKAEAESPDRDMKLIAIQDIKGMVDDGSAADNPENEADRVGILHGLIRLQSFYVSPRTDS